MELECGSKTPTMYVFTWMGTDMGGKDVFTLVLIFISILKITYIMPI